MTTLTGGTRTSIRLSPERIGVRDVPSSTALAGFLYGTTDPTTVAAGLKPGIGYLNTLTGDFFQLGANMQWAKVGTVRGPAGAPGPGYTDEAIAEIKAALLVQIEADIIAGLTPTDDPATVGPFGDPLGLEPDVDLVVLFENKLV